MNTENAKPSASFPINIHLLVSPRVCKHSWGEAEIYNQTTLHAQFNIATV